MSKIVCPACKQEFKDWRTLGDHVAYGELVLFRPHCWCGFSAIANPNEFAARSTYAERTGMHLSKVGDLEQHYVISMMRRLDG